MRFRPLLLHYRIATTPVGQQAMADDLLPVKSRSLTAAQLDQLSDVPPEEEWLANIRNEKTRRAYRSDVREFMAFMGLMESVKDATDSFLPKDRNSNAYRRR